MGISYKLDGDVLLVRQQGVADPDDIRTVMKSAFSEMNSPKNIHLLWDARESPAEASSEKIKNLLHLGPALSGRIAILVSSQLQYGLARMTVAYGEQLGLSVRVLRDLDEASTWLRTSAPGVGSEVKPTC